MALLPAPASEAVITPARSRRHSLLDVRESQSILSGAKVPPVPGVLGGPW